MYVHEGNHMSDAWYHVEDDVVHMFYLTQPLSTAGPPVVGHAVSGDLVRWERLAPALRTGPPGSWDDLRVCSGSVIKRDGRTWMGYSATNITDSSPAEMWRTQRVGLAVSDDLLDWEKLHENPVTQSSPPRYEQMSTGQRKMVHWRDPFLFDSGDGVYQLICARRVDGDVATRGTVALARSTDMHTWEVLPPLEHDAVSEEMEVPQVYLIGGRWYLLFCTLGRFLSPEFAQRFDGQLPERTNFSMVGDSPLGPFHIHGTGQIVAHGLDDYFYAAQLVNLRGKWYLLATVHDKEGERISDPIPVRADETGVHAVL